MTSTTEISLVAQREALREKLRAQRQLIADQLGPPADVNGGYPRSKTMRFLTQQSGLTVTLLAEIAALLLGARHVKTMATVLAVARIVGAASIGRPRQPAASRESD